MHHAHCEDLNKILSENNDESVFYEVYNNLSKIHFLALLQTTSFRG